MTKAHGRDSHPPETGKWFEDLRTKTAVDVEAPHLLRRAGLRKTHLVQSRSEAWQALRSPRLAAPEEEPR